MSARRPSPNAIVRRVLSGGGRRVSLRQVLGRSTRSKFGSHWTYYNGGPLHTCGRDCIAATCPYQLEPHIKTDRVNWYPSRAEATYAQHLDWMKQVGLIIVWARCSSIVVHDAVKRADRITYKPDFDVWEHYPLIPVMPDYRVEVKGSRLAMSRDVSLRIRLYRDLVERGEQPPLRVVNAKGEPIDV
jgi:hypothetical protein